jgi:hypothetical protein
VTPRTRTTAATDDATSPTSSNRRTASRPRVRRPGRRPGSGRSRPPADRRRGTGRRRLPRLSSSRATRGRPRRARRGRPAHRDAGRVRAPTAGRCGLRAGRVLRTVAFELATSDAVLRFAGLGFGCRARPRLGGRGRVRRRRPSARRSRRPASDRPRAPVPRALGPQRAPSSPSCPVTRMRQSGLSSVCG